MRPGRYVCVTACRNLYETWSVCTTGLRELAQTARTFGIVVDGNCGNGGMVGDSPDFLLPVT